MTEVTPKYDATERVSMNLPPGGMEGVDLYRVCQVSELVNSDACRRPKRQTEGRSRSMVTRTHAPRQAESLSWPTVTRAHRRSRWPSIIYPNPCGGLARPLLGKSAAGRTALCQCHPFSTSAHYIHVLAGNYAWLRAAGTRNPRRQPCKKC